MVGAESCGGSCIELSREVSLESIVVLLQEVSCWETILGETGLARCHRLYSCHLIEGRPETVDETVQLGVNVICSNITHQHASTGPCHGRRVNMV